MNKAKEKAIKWLCNQKEFNNRSINAIEEALDIALKEQAKQIFEELDFMLIDDLGYPQKKYAFLCHKVSLKNFKNKWLK